MSCQWQGIQVCIREDYSSSHQRTMAMVRKQQNYYFCDDLECDVVYLRQDDPVIEKSELRTIVGIKDKSDTFMMLCRV